MPGTVDKAVSEGLQEKWSNSYWNPESRRTLQFNSRNLSNTVACSYMKSIKCNEQGDIRDFQQQY